MAASQPNLAAPDHKRAETVLISAALVLLTGIAYGPVLANDFVNYDDDIYVTRNAHVQGGLSRPGIRWAFTSTDALNWHPLTWISLQLDAQLYGAHAWGFHLTSLLLHTANTILLFLVLRRMTGVPAPSALVAALFALHPLHVESVAWIAERKDVLSTLFWMLTLAFYTQFVKRPGRGRYLLVMLALALGLMAKPMLVTLPCVLLLLDYWPLGRFERWQFVEKLPLFGLVAAASAITVYAQQRAGAIEPLSEVSLPARIANALVSYVQYLFKMCWPTDLAPLYPHPRDGLSWAQAAGGGALLVGVSVLTIMQSRRRPYLLVGWFWYLGTLVPVIGLVQVGEQSRADRYTYVPLIGVFIMLAWGASELYQRARFRYAWLALPAAALVACVTLTWRQARLWHDSRSLWEHTLRVTVDNYVAENNLGFALFEGGKYTQAEEHFRSALRIKPDYVRACANLGLALDKRGRAAEAVDWYRKTLELHPNLAATRNNLGVALAKQGKMDDALDQLQEAVRIDPTFTEAVYNLAFALARQKRFDQAIAYCRDCIRVEPQNARFRFALADLLRQQGQVEEAMRQYQEGERLNRLHR
jgi:Flp pilus assembly protein TadD